ncbi:MAG: TonB-dependent receptor [Dissulfurispiraceae bacterium]
MRGRTFASGIRSVFVMFFIALFASSAFAESIQTLDVVEVTESADNPIGITDSATEGTAPTEEVQSRPYYRPGELLEITPGLIVTQHSGEGKANQYFLRGVNLDHGTDLRITVDGMLVNERTNAHGQGYSDLNFMIPELIEDIQYRKGPYYADYGDFSSVGAIDIHYVNTLPQGIAKTTVGFDGYERQFLADSIKLGAGNLLGAVEYVHNDGPWANKEDFRKVNGALRYTAGDFTFAAMAYTSQGIATNQIPDRALSEDLITRYGSLNPSDFTFTRRYSLSGAWQHTTGDTVDKANIYIIDKTMELFSDFTYFLNDPVHGDQFEQWDKRTTEAANASHTWTGKLFGREMENEVGIQLQFDYIHNGLNHTEDRQLIEVWREDRVNEDSEAAYFQNTFHWFEKFRTEAGLRWDLLQINDQSAVANSGNVSANMLSPKLNLIFGPWYKTEFYINTGQGFHSNDARSCIDTSVPLSDPSAGPNQKVEPLVRSEGYDVGARTVIIPGLQSSLTFFQLHFDSELEWDGDTGETSPGRPSLRTGFEFTNSYSPAKWLTIDLDYAYTKARSEGAEVPVVYGTQTVYGNYIPGAVEGVGSLGIQIHDVGRYFGSLKVRYLGGYPLIEDNSQRQGASTLLEAQIGYKFSKHLTMVLEGLNLTNNKKAADVAYYYTSRLPGEPSSGVNDIHFKPVEPLNARLSLIYYF